MVSSGSMNAPNTAAESGTSFLEADAARDRLFNKILDQLAETSLFSNSIRAPNIFIVYAHDNKKEGPAYDGCVRKIIIWLRKIHARILSDQSPLPPLRRRVEGDDAIRNILANQLCLLPPKPDSAGMPTITTVDNVIVCGSRVLERYYSVPSALSYISDVVHICTTGVDQSTGALQSRIVARVETESNEDDFHHIYTELAFLEFRKSVLPQTHGMVPVVLSQSNTDDAPMRYLPMFYNTDVKLKLKSPAACNLHKLFFKLLEQLFPDDRDFIRPFRDCYDSVMSKLQMEDETRLSRQEFDNIVNQRITRAYQEYWSLFCVLVRDGKLQAYSGKLSEQVSSSLRTTELRVKHDILKWLSPISATELHGRFQDSGTARMEGTCDWVIKDRKFQRWYTSNSSTLLLLRGDMGMGKTYSTSRVVDWIKHGLSTNNNHEAFAYFYCNKQDSMLREPKEILRNIIRQMATGPWREGGKGETIHKTVHELWEASQAQGISSTFAQWKACLLALIDTYPRTTIVLDGLDECENRQDLIEVFQALAMRHPGAKPVKIFLSTRPEVDVLQHFDKYPAIRMKGKHNADDIATFVRTKFAERSSWSEMSKDFRAEVIHTLLEKSGDMFLFASLQIKSLQDCWFEEDIREGLQSLPGTLAATYEEIYRRAANKTSAKRFIDRALRWVMCSSRPMTTDELLFAICQDPDADCITAIRHDLSAKLILKLCHSLLILDNSTGRDPVWRLAHQAVGEFFETSIYFNTDLAHYEVGKVCLMVLLDTFGDEPTQSRSDLEDDVSETGAGFACPCENHGEEHRIMENSFAEYAIWAWPTHVRAQEHREACSVAGLSQKLQEFLGEPEQGSVIYERWIEHLLKCVRWPPRWSIFATRRMPSTWEREHSLKPISLACHLGFYTTLAEWWDHTRFDENFVHYACVWNPGLQLSFRNMNILNSPLRWSLVALACAHSETKILKRLLDRGAQVNPVEEEEVPSIVATAMSNSVESAKELLQRGSEMCSPFTRSHGHVLSLAITEDSLEVAELLLRRGFNVHREVERALAELPQQLLSAEAITLLLDTDVNVNTALHDGTLLGAAVCGKWKRLVRRLLDHGADVNTPLKGGNFKNVLEAALFLSDLSTARSLMEYGANVTTRTIAWASERLEDKPETFEILLMHNLDLDETWTDDNSDSTSALIETVKFGKVNGACILIQYGADVNLKVGGEYGDPLSAMGWALLDDLEYPAAPMITVLNEAGASLETLEGDRLNHALLAAANAGLEDMVHRLLARGASPNAFCVHRWITALCAAAASKHPRASNVIRMLLDHGADVNTYFPACIDGSPGYSNDRFVLDYPLYLLLLHEDDHSKLLYNWLQSVFVLLSNGAIWDIDFVQWRECFENRAPQFASRNAGYLDQLRQMLKRNRKDFFRRNPGAASDIRWRIKDTDSKYETRTVLSLMEVLQRSPGDV